MAYPPLTGLFAERYLIERELGHGATAVVYLARDQKHNRDIALKVLSKDLAHALGPQRFLREIQLTSRLHHPHILPIFDSGEWNGMLYYVLPFVRGESLHQRIEREKQLPIEDCVRITCEVADALAHAHAHGIVHRDVKPENIMLSDGHALLADFGIARTLDVHTGERLTSSGLIVGTSAYMSPEQAAGEENIDARSDIYSLACVLYEMIAGVQAFTGPTTQSVIAQRFKHTPRPVSTFRPQVPEYLERALEKALTISPADRYRKIKDFAADLPDSPGAGRDRRQAPLRRMIHDHQKAFGFGAAALVAITAAFVAVNPPGNWRSPFARMAVLDSTRYIVIPSQSGGRAEIVAADVDAAATLGRELTKFSGLKLADPIEIREAVNAKPRMGREDAIALARKLAAGRMIRINASGDASAYDVANDTVTNEITLADLTGSANRYSAAALKLLAAKDRPSSAAGGDGRTTSFVAWSAYGRAHAAIASHDFTRARAEFARALAADDAYAPARVWSAQLAEWMEETISEDWKPDALRAAAAAATLAPRERSIALALGELAKDHFPEACAEYRKVVAADSVDFAGWMGLGECHRLDSRVIASRGSPSGFYFRSSSNGAYAEFTRATDAFPGAFDLIGFERMRRLKLIDANTMHRGEDDGKRSYGAYPSVENDTVAYVPYPMARFVSLPATALATRRAALDNNIATLLEYTRAWSRALPQSGPAYEALATVLEARGEIDQASDRELSASGALARALQLSSMPAERVRIRASEMRLRLKRGEFASARTLADSLLKYEPATDRSVLDELIIIAVVTGRANAAARFAEGSIYAPMDIRGTRIQPQVASAAALFLMRGALGDCSSASESARADLENQLRNYYSEKEAAALRESLESRPLLLLGQCNGGRSSLLATGSSDKLARMEQALASGNIKAVRSILDSLDAHARFFRPGDLSLDYTHQEAWLRAAIGDTVAAIRQLDATLSALPGLGRATLRDPGGAAALGRAMSLRAEIAAATGDRATARKFAKAVAELWAEADPGLQPLVAKMKMLAGMAK